MSVPEAAAAPATARQPARGRERLADAAFTLALFALAAVKLWCVRDQTVAAIGWSVHDDALYVRAARNLLAGRWLGPYDQMTLLKGPGYSLWLAFTARLGVPLLLAQHLLYLGACALLIAALRPRVASRSALLLLFAALAMSPATFGASALRVVRAGIYPALVLLVVACWIGLHGSALRRGPARIAWALALGATLWAFWITREEGVWVLPLLLPALAYTAVCAGRGGARAAGTALALCALPLALAAAGVFGVALVNRAHYGIPVVVELKSGPFLSAYGALQRVKPAHFEPGVAVTQEARERIYAVSPAFRELRPFLEGPGGRAWGREASRWLGRPLVVGEIAGDRMIFALRDAVAWAGYYASGPRAMAYYTRLAREVNGACEDGRLPAGPRRASWLPPWRPEYGVAVARALPLRVAELLSLAPIRIEPAQSYGSDASLAGFAEITHETLAPRAGDPPPPAAVAAARARSLARLRAVYAFYARTLPAAALLAGAGLLVGGLSLLRRRRLSFELVLACGLLAALAARSAALVYVDVTSFPTWRGHYLAPAYPPLLLFCFAGILTFARSRAPEAPRPDQPAAVGTRCTSGST